MRPPPAHRRLPSEIALGRVRSSVHCSVWVCLVSQHPVGIHPPQDVGESLRDSHETWRLPPCIAATAENPVRPAITARGLSTLQRTDRRSIEGIADRISLFPRVVRQGGQPGAERGNRFAVTTRSGFKTDCCWPLGGRHAWNSPGSQTPATGCETALGNRALKFPEEPKKQTDPLPRKLEEH